LRAARAIIRRHGFTIAQAHAGALPGSRAAWQRASAAASAIFTARLSQGQAENLIQPNGCPNFRLWVRPHGK
jgi:hypothetical protein